MKVLQLIVCWQFTCLMAKEVIVQIASGKVRGTVNYTVPNGNIYNAFKGIRYGHIPERFEPAVPAKSWSGIYDATEDKNVCIQVPKSALNESEDCLYISVYTPKYLKKSGDGLAVLLWVYGGGFIFGHNNYDLYGPDRILDGGVVVVSLNYRVNVFGFMSTGNSTIPGNMGIKDVILGLDWVQENIKAFGGDPKRVTIFGHSAGAVIVGTLLFSPMVKNKGYFQGAIIQSANSIVPWGIRRDPACTYKLIAEQANCSHHRCDKDVLKCLKTAPVDSLRNISHNILGSGLVIGYNLRDCHHSFGVVVEPPGPTSACSEDPWISLTHRKPGIPIIMGIVSEEALYMANSIPNMNISASIIDDSPELLVPPDVNVFGEKRKKVGRDIKDHYYSQPTLATFQTRYVRYLSDMMFNAPVWEYLLNVHDNDVFWYLFAYHSSATGEYTQLPGLGSDGHSAELNLLFKMQQNENVTLSPMDNLNIKRLIKLWTNFAKYGNPTPPIKDSKDTLGNIKWPNSRTSGTNLKCLYINETLSIVDNPKKDAYQFWSRIYSKYGRVITETPKKC